MALATTWQTRDERRERARVFDLADQLAVARGNDAREGLMDAYLGMSKAE